MPENLPTYRAVLTIPAGIDETRLAVVDDTSVIAETTWRRSDNYQPGPTHWDWALYRLGYDRRSPWPAGAARVRLRGRAHLPRRPVLIDDLPRREVLRIRMESMLRVIEDTSGRSPNSTARHRRSGGRGLRVVDGGRS